MTVTRNLSTGRRSQVVTGDMDVYNNLHVGGILSARVIRGRNAFCGLYADETALNTHCGNPVVGQWAMTLIENRTAQDTAMGEVWICETDGTWTDAEFTCTYAEFVEQMQAEAEARETADEVLQGNIDAEASARESADSTLQGNINAEKSSRESADSTLQGNIDAEASARESADSTLQGNIDAEASARESADSTLQGNIDAEASARESADSTLQGNINTEKSARESADAALQDNIDAEEQARIADVNTLQGSINAEKSTRESADAALQLAINAEKSARESADTTLQGNIDAEASARESADLTLQAAINAEKSARESADLTLQANIDAEKHTRESADDSLLQKINVEKQERIDGDMKLFSEDMGLPCCQRKLARKNIGIPGDLDFLIEDGAITNKKIHDKAVTGNKIGDGEVKENNVGEGEIKSRHIGNGEVKENNIGDGEIKSRHIGGGEVKANNLDNGAVVPEKLCPELISLIYSAGAHGYHLSNEFGASDLIGISQRTLTIAVNRIWEKLEEITGEVLKGISMVVSPEYYIGEEGCDVHVTANTVEANGIFEKIAFFVNGIKVWPLDADYAENVETVEFDTHIDDTAVIKCEAQILGVPYERQKAITHYSSFWLGAGSTYEDIMDVTHLIPIENGMRGAYDVDIADSDHIIVIVGESLASGFIRADINGAEIAFTESTVTIDGNIYKVFTSESTFEEGTINVDING